MKNYTRKYYIYTLLTQARFTRIISILFIVQVLKLDLIQFSLVQSIFLFSQFFSEIPSGIIGDMFNNKTVIFSGLFLLAIAPLITVSSFFLPSNITLIILVISSVLEGIGNALISGADDALFYEGIRKDGNENDYGKIRGNMQFISSVVVGLATAIGGYLFSLNYALPYIFQSIFILGAVVVIVFTKENKVTKAESEQGEETLSGMFKNILSVFKDMVHSSNILFLFVFTILVTSVINAIFMLLPNYISNLGFDSSANGSVFMIYSLAGGLIATQAYRLTKMKFSSLTILIASLLFFATGLELQQNKYLFLIGAGILYIVLDILDPIVMQMLNLWVSDTSRATFISGLSFSISLMTMIINPIIGTSIQRYGTINMLISTSLVTIFMIFAAYYLIVKTKKKSS